MPSSAERRPAAVHGRPLAAFLDGWRRAIHAPAVAGGVLLATFLTALPLAVVLGAAIETQLASSLQADQAASGWNEGWATEFNAGAAGLSRTFTHEILGFGGTIANVSEWLDRKPLDPAVASAIAVYLGIWTFLSGGILDRLARSRAIGGAAFFSACGAYFFRFVRLAIPVGAAYWALFRWLHPFLFVTLYNRWTRDMTAESQGIALRIALYALFLLALVLVNVVADFAKVRAVVEDRRSMIGAIGASLRFLRRRVWRVAGLYLFNVVALFVILRLWLQVAPSGWAPNWIALLVAQAYLLARVWAKLAFLGSEIAFFQDELAHAGYSARPLPLWPDSPSAEGIRNLVQRNGPAKPRWQPQ